MLLSSFLPPQALSGPSLHLYSSLSMLCSSSLILQVSQIPGLYQLSHTWRFFFIVNMFHPQLPLQLPNISGGTHKASLPGQSGPGSRTKAHTRLRLQLLESHVLDGPHPSAHLFPWGWGLIPRLPLLPFGGPRHIVSGRASR